MSTIEFPTVVYRNHGPHARQGGTYDYVSAVSEAHLSTLLDEGWFLTLPEAIKGTHYQGELQQDGEAPGETQKSPAGVVRDWLLSKLEEAGIETEADDSNEVLLSAAANFVADQKLEKFKATAEPSATQWLGDKATSIGIQHEGLNADELLLLICNAYATKPEDETEEQKAAALESLKKQADALGIKHDGRSTVESLSRAIAEKAGE